MHPGEVGRMQNLELIDVPCCKSVFVLTQDWEGPEQATDIVALVGWHEVDGSLKAAGSLEEQHLGETFKSCR
jgi:hypothetical protein